MWRFPAIRFRSAFRPLIAALLFLLAGTVAFAADDPYARAGLFASVAVTAWRQVLPRT